MKRLSAPLLILLFLAAANKGYCGTVAAPYQVGTWQGFRTAAVSYVSDSAYLQNIYDIGVPMFNNYGYKLTLFEIPNWNPPWAKAQAAAAQGHEVASLLMTHADLATANEATAIWELSQSQIVINSYIPGNQCLIVGYPQCHVAYKNIVAQYYIAARTCSSSINPSTPTDFYAIHSLIVGSAGSLNSTASIIAKHNQAASSGGWVVYLVHAIDSEGGYSPISSTILNETLQYLDANRSTFWVNTFLNVVKYIRERNDVSVSELENKGDSISISVTDTLNNTIYNFPITIRRPLPSGWTTAYAAQNGQAIPVSIVNVSSVDYVMFDAVPDAGPVTLYKSLPEAPTGLTAAAGIDGVILLNWNDNIESSLAGYNVYRATSPEDDFTVLNGSPSTSSDYTDTDVSFGTTYYYVVTAIDVGAHETDCTGVESAMPRAANGVGAVLREWWTGIEGGDVASLTSNENYPDNPAGRALLTMLASPVNWDDNYGTRIRGYLYPPTSGDYTFWLTGDDSAELWLSTDANLSNKTLIASVSSPGVQQSSPIPLLSGQKYYIEVLHKESAGDDKVAVVWERPGISPQIIDGFYLSPCCIDFRDYASFASQWTQGGCDTGNGWCDGVDFLRDGSVGLDDLKALSDSWLSGL